MSTTQRSQPKPNDMPTHSVTIAPDWVTARTYEASQVLGRSGEDETVTTIRVEKKTTHVPVLKQALDDPRLSLAAKGMWAYLEAHPELDAAGIEADDLARRGVGEADEIQRCLDELIQAGYLGIV